MSTTINILLSTINILSYSVVFIEKINLLCLRHWCFPAKFMNFSEAPTGGVLWKKLFLEISQYSQKSYRPATSYLHILDWRIQYMNCNHKIYLFIRSCRSTFEVINQYAKHTYLIFWAQMSVVFHGKTDQKNW